MTEAEWLACTDPVEMLRSVWGDASDRKVRLYLCGGCRHVAHLFFRPESLTAVEVAERFADGLASEEELGKAGWDAESPTFGLDFDERFLERAPHRHEVLAALIERGAVPQSVLSGGEWRVDEAVQTRLLAAAKLAEFCAEWCREAAEWGLDNIQEVDWPGRWLSDCVFGDPFLPVGLDAACLTPAVVSLARAAYEERLLPSGELDGARLAVLADALEDAGAGGGILGHLRGPGPHVRGCWALDLVLGKE